MQVAAITYLCILIITFLIQRMPASFLALNGNERQGFFVFCSYVGEVCRATLSHETGFIDGHDLIVRNLMNLPDNIQCYRMAGVHASPSHT